MISKADLVPRSPTGRTHGLIVSVMGNHDFMGSPASFQKPWW